MINSPAALSPASAWPEIVDLDAIPVPPEGGRGAVHLRIIRALQGGDADASIAAMQQHFDDIRARAALLRRPESDAG